MRPGRLPWSPEETAILTRMRLDGAEASEIAKVLGRSVAAVSSKTSDMSPIGVDDTPPPASQVRICSTRAELVTATLMGDPPHGRSALDQRASK